MDVLRPLNDVLVKDLYGRVGFTRHNDGTDGAVEYRLDLEKAKALKTFVLPGRPAGVIP